MPVESGGNRRVGTRTTWVSLRREVRMPDPVRLARYRKAPELGPRVLFFSGGTALNPVSRVLTEYTHNSIHLVTPFDSGGSSAKLRDAFGMLSVGDLRSRLMAMADQSLTGHPDIYRLFAYRFPKHADNDELKNRLDSLVCGEDQLVAAIPDPMRKLIRNHLRYFQSEMPDDFDLRGASIGNLILVGGYLNNDRHIDPVVYMFSKLVEVLGTVRTVVTADLNLAACLADGRTVIGQRNMTGKDVAPLETSIEYLFLVNGSSPEPTEVSIRRKTRDLIDSAELICYPVGSFYTSLIANLLPAGVSAAVAANNCPKVYIPNMGVDPEQHGRSVTDCTAQLIAYLGKEGEPTERLLNFVIVDTESGSYATPIDVGGLENLGVEVIDTDLVQNDGSGMADPSKLVDVILSLV